LATWAICLSTSANCFWATVSVATKGAIWARVDSSIGASCSFSRKVSVLEVEIRTPVARANPRSSVT
jgi:hypothetical protein